MIEHFRRSPNTHHPHIRIVNIRTSKSVGSRLSVVSMTYIIATWLNEQKFRRSSSTRQRWWELAGQALLVGVSASLSHHVLTRMIAKPEKEEQPSLMDSVVDLTKKKAREIELNIDRLPRWCFIPLIAGPRSLLYASSMLFLCVKLWSSSIDPDMSDCEEEEEEDEDSEEPVIRTEMKATSRDSPSLPPPRVDYNTIKDTPIFREVIRGKQSGFPPKATKRSNHSQRYLELLVHNVSHTDLVLGIESPELDGEKECYIRPRFSTFDMLSRLVLGYARVANNSNEVVDFPLNQRLDDRRYSICESDHGSPKTPTGLKLSSPAPLPATCGLQDIRARESDEERIERLFQATAAKPKVTHVFFPLLAALLPVWSRQIARKEYKSSFVRVLVLVTGVGTPRNRAHSVSGNSTEKCAELMEIFLKLIDPSLVVVKIHSETNLFRYDENLLFVERDLLPTLNGYRDTHATGNPYPHEEGALSSRPNGPYDTEWRSSMQVTLSSADGSGARTHAIQASLRPFRPTYFHFWQLKTFWHESKIVEDDIEVHSFETMENLPAVDVDRIKDQPDLNLVVAEMRAFYQEMLVALSSTENDIHKFWLRKTHQPVLAILLVRSEGREKPQLYRGSNMEVSMPTGSLCAERNAIGSALSMNPKLKREDLKMVAVLAVPPVEVSLEDGISRVHSVSSFVEEFGADGRGSRKPSLGSEVDSGEWVLSDQPESTKGPSMNSSPLGSDIEEQAPLRRIMLYSKPSATRKGKRTVVVQSTKDVNPLKPCGACNEWLKKIAECNPYFRIVTFTDANCNGVYCQPCQE